MFISFHPATLLVETYQREIFRDTQKNFMDKVFFLDQVIRKTQEENKYSTTENWLNFIVHPCWNTM